MTLSDKINTISEELRAVKWTLKNGPQGHYKYVDADDALKEIGHLMNKHGVVVIPSVKNASIQTYDYVTKYGDAKTRYDAIIEMRMEVSDGNEMYYADWVGAGDDQAVSTKAIYGAITSGHKYFLAKLFMLPLGNENNEHQESDSGAIKTRKAAKQAKEPAKETPPVTETGTAYGWSSWLLEKIVEAKYVGHPKHAAALLDLSTINLENHNDDRDEIWGVVEAWLKDYKKERPDSSSKVTAKQAAATANNAYDAMYGETAE